MLDFLRSTTALVGNGLVVDTSDEVVELLTRFRDSNAEALVQIEGEDTSYSCSISAFNVKHRAIVVSNLSPNPPMKLLPKGKAVRVIVRDQRDVANIECSYLEPLVANQTTALQLKMPKKLGIQYPNKLRNLFSGMQGENLALSKHGTS